MAANALQDYCLGVMGITQWQLRSNTVEPKPFMFLVNESLNEEKNQLLLRLMQALKWPAAKTQIEVLTAWSTQAIEALTGQYQVQKIVLFNEQYDFSSKEITSVVIPSIEEMLKNIEAKKRAWALLQRLIEK